MEKTNFLSKISKSDLNDFMSICENAGVKLPTEKFIETVFNTLKYLSGDKSKRDELRHTELLENKWYKSLEGGSPDFSVYDDVYYLAETWVCWKKYSREYIKRLIKHTNITGVKTIADLGNGIGYSSVALQETYNAEVIGTNIKDSKQWKICEEVFKLNDRCRLTDSLKSVGNVDLVFASEYFEHFENPVEHLEEVIKEISPAHFLFANTFNAKSIGHFDVYFHRGEAYSGRQISRIFNNYLKSKGYEKVKTGCWNNRPNYYKKIK